MFVIRFESHAYLNILTFRFVWLHLILLQRHVQHVSFIELLLVFRSYQNPVYYVNYFLNFLCKGILVTVFEGTGFVWCV